MYLYNRELNSYVHSIAYHSERSDREMIDKSNLMDLFPDLA